MRLKSIYEAKAEIPDAKIYYRVFNVDSGKDSFPDNAIEALRDIQSFSDTDVGSVTTYYGVGDVGPANWASNIAYEYYHVVGGAKKSLHPNFPDGNDPGFVHWSSADIEAHLEPIPQELEQAGLNPEFEIPASDLFQYFQQLLSSSPASEPDTVRLKSMPSDRLQNDPDFLQIGLK